MKNKPNSFAPFDLDNEADYQAWREQKLLDYPTSVEALIVEIYDPHQLTDAEYEAIHARCC